MPKTSTIPPVSKDNINRARKIVAETTKHLAKGIRFVVGAGAFLVAIKTEVKHGEFGPWLKENVFPKLKAEAFDSQWRKMRLWMETSTAAAELAGVEWPEVDPADIYTAITAAKGKVPAKLRKVREALDVVIEGKTQRELVIEWRVATEDQTGTNHPPLTPEEQTQMEFEFAVSHYDTLRGSMLVEAGEGGKWHLLPKEKRWQFIVASLPLLKAMAVNTEWTPQEREQVRQQIISISAELSGKPERRAA